jgi:hypothetical protein
VTQSLSISAEHDYSAEEAISVPVTLRSGRDVAVFDAYVDTGSTFCVFKRGHSTTSYAYP